MNLFYRAARALLLATLFSVGVASAADKGIDYIPIIPEQPTDSGKKVEVVEVFSYACPHCANLAPSIEAWARKLPANVVYKRIPVSFGRQQWAVMSKTYYALEAMNEADRLHEKIFSAIHTEKLNLFSEDILFDWIAKQGVNRQKFLDAYNSFAVQSKLARGDQKSMAYGVDSVPTIIIDGKYRTSPSIAGGNATLFPLMDELIKKAAKERGL
jgi:thiol:disulfide interchange protein DsbA